MLDFLAVWCLWNWHRIFWYIYQVELELNNLTPPPQKKKICFIEDFSCKNILLTNLFLILISKIKSVNLDTYIEWCAKDIGSTSSSRFSSLWTIWPQISPVCAEFVWLIRCLIKWEGGKTEVFKETRGGCTSTNKLDPPFLSCSSLNNFHHLSQSDDETIRYQFKVWSKVHASIRERLFVFLFVFMFTICSLNCFWIKIQCINLYWMHFNSTPFYV